MKIGCYRVCLTIIASITLFGCDHEQKISVPGYLDAKYTYVSASFSGTLQTLNVQPGDQVKQNQPLFTLETLPESADLQAAKARWQEAKDQIAKSNAELTLKQADFSRRQRLYQREVISKEEFESSQAGYLQALSQTKALQATLDARKADVEKYQWATQQKAIASPFSSTVFDTYYSKGEYIAVGRPVVSLLEKGHLKVVFFIPQAHFSQLHLKQAIKVTCDNCTPFNANISYISNKAEFTPPVIYSTEEKAKLVYRIEAIPDKKNAEQHLNSGQPVTITFKVKKTS